MPVWLEKVKPEDLPGASEVIICTPNETRLLYSRKTGPEALAHEIGHIALGNHLAGPPESLQEFVNREVDAWFWAWRKRGRKPREFINIILGGINSEYPEAKPREITRAVDKALGRHGRGLSHRSYWEDAIRSARGEK